MMSEEFELDTCAVDVGKGNPHFWDELFEIVSFDEERYCTVIRVRFVELVFFRELNSHHVVDEKKPYFCVVVFRFLILHGPRILDDDSGKRLDIINLADLCVRNDRTQGFISALK